MMILFKQIVRLRSLEWRSYTITHKPLSIHVFNFIHLWAVQGMTKQRGTVNIVHNALSMIEAAQQSMLKGNKPGLDIMKGWN